MFPEMEISVGFRGRTEISAAASAPPPLVVVLMRLRSWASVLRHMVRVCWTGGLLQQCTNTKAVAEEKVTDIVGPFASLASVIARYFYLMN